MDVLESLPNEYLLLLLLRSRDDLPQRRFYGQTLKKGLLKEGECKGCSSDAMMSEVLTTDSIKIVWVGSLCLQHFWLTRRGR